VLRYVEYCNKKAKKKISSYKERVVKKESHDNLENETVPKVQVAVKIEKSIIWGKKGYEGGNTPFGW